MTSDPVDHVYYLTKNILLWEPLSKAYIRWEIFHGVFVPFPQHSLFQWAKHLHQNFSISNKVQINVNKIKSSNMTSHTIYLHLLIKLMNNLSIFVVLLI